MRGAPLWQCWWGANTGASSKPFRLAITSVDPNGPAAHAGLRRGDLINIRANSLLERYSVFNVPLNGRSFTLSEYRDSLQKKFTVVPQPSKITWSFWLGTFVAPWLLLFAALIAWRRADVPQMQLLSLWLATFVLTGGFPDHRSGQRARDDESCDAALVD
jgi:4-amino-4-deoxy-L-arabinose transferase-like glycosyltransferase